MYAEAHLVYLKLYTHFIRYLFLFKKKNSSNIIVVPHEIISQYYQFYKYLCIRFEIITFQQHVPLQKNICQNSLTV